MDGNKSNNSGCLALIGIIGIILLIVNTCGDKGTKTSTKKTVEKERRAVLDLFLYGKTTAVSVKELFIVVLLM